MTSETIQKYAEINDQSIKALIDHFYGKILQDDLVGPLFKRHIGESLDQWGDHLLTMYRFWASVMNGTGQYKGSPHMVHSRFAHEAEPEFFQRWLKLWFTSCDEIMTASEADKFKKKAEMIAKSLHYTMFDDKMPEEFLPDTQNAA